MSLITRGSWHHGSERMLPPSACAWPSGQVQNLVGEKVTRRSCFPIDLRQVGSASKSIGTSWSTIRVGITICKWLFQSVHGSHAIVVFDYILPLMVHNPSVWLMIISNTESAWIVSFHWRLVVWLKQSVENLSFLSKWQQGIGLKGKRLVGAHVWRDTTSVPHQPFAGCHVCGYTILAGG